VNDYDKLINSIADEMYAHLEEMSPDQYWSESIAKETAHRIFKLIEEYQEQQPKIKSWRASD